VIRGTLQVNHLLSLFSDRLGGVDIGVITVVGSLLMRSIHGSERWKTMDKNQGMRSKNQSRS
jgi:hypothetical protein